MISTASSSYVNPLLERYASAEMSCIFSPDNKFSTWRKLWIALAESQKKLGLPITSEQILEMKNHISDIDYPRVKQIEAELRHDVMAHVHAFGECCPKAKPIIHLGATSAFVGDNTDLIQMRQGCRLLVRRLTGVIALLKDFAIKYKDMPTLGFTHFQPAQLTTVGKRACLWILDLSMDFETLDSFIVNLPFRGVKGTTGTQASFLRLFEGDHEKVKQLDKMVSGAMDFARTLPITGQTYTRKIDATLAFIIDGLAQSLHKMANDIRLLQHLKEIEEPFEKNQVGSSAMAYKRNPMRSERLTSLARFIMSLSHSPSMTAAEQWFERTLDDSANKRLAIPELFLAADASLILARNIIDGLVVYPGIIERHIQQELPFMATENIIMEAVLNGADRQEAHEHIRRHSIDAARQIKECGRENDLLDRIAADPLFRLDRRAIDSILVVGDFVGRAPAQVIEFIEETIEPLLKRGYEYGSIEDSALSV